LILTVTAGQVFCPAFVLGPVFCASSDVKL
jgi:hypothetical protein